MVLEKVFRMIFCSTPKPEIRMQLIHWKIIYRHIVRTIEGRDLTTSILVRRTHALRCIIRAVAGDRSISVDLPGDSGSTVGAKPVRSTGRYRRRKTRRYMASLGYCRRTAEEN